VESIQTVDTPTISVELPEESVQVQGHVDSLVRLFTNLLENSARHTSKDGSIAIFAATVADRVIVTVTDTGEGIPPEHLPHVFERFYRVDDSRTRSQGGTGLGLAICQTIVEGHGGSMMLDSTVGVGTSVRVVLERANPPAIELLPDETIVGSKGGYARVTDPVNKSAGI